MKNKISDSIGCCEKLLWKKGYKNILFVDEVGRGSLAGPLVVGGVILDKNFDFEKEKWVNSVKDSKKLTSKKRQEIFQIASKHPLIHWEIIKISNKIVDKINILESFKLGAIKLIDKFNKNLPNENKVDFLILDGNTKIGVGIPYKSIIRADERFFSCSLASIIAKVKRDKMMQDYDKEYPEFLFFKNKGYGTKEHFKSIRKYGFSPLHRKSFLKKL